MSQRAVQMDLDMKTTLERDIYTTAPGEVHACSE
jgi:hypothetical protein